MYLDIQIYLDIKKWWGYWDLNPGPGISPARGWSKPI